MNKNNYQYHVQQNDNGWLKVEKNNNALIKATNKARNNVQPGQIRARPTASLNKTQTTIMNRNNRRRNNLNFK